MAQPKFIHPFSKTIKKTIPKGNVFEFSLKGDTEEPAVLRYIIFEHTPVSENTTIVRVSLIYNTPGGHQNDISFNPKSLLNQNIYWYLANQEGVTLRIEPLSVQADVQISVSGEKLFY